MRATPESRESLLRELIAVPSITGSQAEAQISDFIFRRVASYDHFLTTPNDASQFDVRGSAARGVFAFVPAAEPTLRTVVLIAHFDTVGTAVYGELEPWAQSPDDLAELLGGTAIDRAAADDLESGRYIFGRGALDMKCGLAVEMELLREFAADRSMFGVNMLFLALPDEENASAGAREAAALLAELKRNNGLEYVCCIDTEPSEPGMPEAGCELIFLGALGKLMPTFYCRGAASHVGSYYHGVSSTLMSSLIETYAEASPKLADPQDGVCHPSWICLRHDTPRDGYSVTVPDRSVIYFNAFVTSKGPREVADEMLRLAERTADETLRRLHASWRELSSMGYSPDGPKAEVSILAFEDILAAAAEQCGGEDALTAKLRAHLAALSLPDERDAGIAALEEALRISGIDDQGPFIAYGFLPPYNPPVSSADDAAERAADAVRVAARSRYGMVLGTVRHFAGLCDLSFFKKSAGVRDAEIYKKNCPGWGITFDIPFDDIEQIDMPVLNLGPKGHDAHKRTERVDRGYSLDILPELIATAIRSL